MPGFGYPAIPPGYPYGFPMMPFGQPGMYPQQPQQPQAQAQQTAIGNSMTQPMAALANAATIEIERQAEADRRSQPSSSGSNTPYNAWPSAPPPMPPYAGFPYGFMQQQQPPQQPSAPASPSNQPPQAAPQQPTDFFAAQQQYNNQMFALQQQHRHQLQHQQQQNQQAQQSQTPSHLQASLADQAASAQASWASRHGNMLDPSHMAQSAFPPQGGSLTNAHDSQALHLPNGQLSPERQLGPGGGSNHDPAGFLQHQMGQHLASPLNHRHAYQTYQPSASTSRNPSPEPSPKEESASPPPPILGGSDLTSHGMPSFRSFVSNDSAAASPMLAPFRGLSLLQQQQQQQQFQHFQQLQQNPAQPPHQLQQTHSHGSSRSGGMTPLTPLSLSRPGSPVQLAGLKLPGAEHFARALEQSKDEQHALEDHHHHPARIHRTNGPYSGHHHSKSRPASPTLDGQGNLIAQYHLSSSQSESGSTYKSLASLRASRSSSPASHSDLVFPHSTGSGFSSRNLHGRLEDILNPSSRSFSASGGSNSASAGSLPPLSSLTSAPSPPQSSSNHFPTRVSHTRSAPASRHNSPPVDMGDGESSSPPDKIRSETNLSSLLSGQVYGQQAPPSMMPPRSNSASGWARKFTMTPINGRSGTPNDD